MLLLLWANYIGNSAQFQRWLLQNVTEGVMSHNCVLTQTLGLSNDQVRWRIGRWAK
tara:strand:- start:471 stop:638 length:168 start_codon:yes stop_codon:yes gene_type:complete